MFRLLTRLLLLSSDGAVVYSGPAAAAAGHFAGLGLAAPAADVHVADYMLDCVIKATPEEVKAMVDAFGSSQVAGDNALQVQQVRQRYAWEQQQQGAAAACPPSKYCASFGTQLRVLCGRLLRNLYRHPMHLYLNFAATLAMAAAMGCVFWHVGVDTGGIQNRLGALFFMLLYLSMMSLSSLPVWSQDRLLFLRERAAGAYCTNAYFVAIVLFDIIPLRVLPPFFFGILSYPLIGLHNPCQWCILRFVAILVLANIATTALCMAIGAALSSVALANAAATCMLLVSALFGGLLVNKDALPLQLRPIVWASPFAAAFEALCVNEFASSDANFWFTSAVNSSLFPAPIPVTGYQVR